MKVFCDYCGQVFSRSRSLIEDHELHFCCPMHTALFFNEQRDRRAKAGGV